MILMLFGRANVEYVFFLVLFYINMIIIIILKNHFLCDRFKMYYAVCVFFFSHQ